MYVYIYIHPDDGKCGHMCQPMVLGKSRIVSGPPMA